MRAPVGAPVMTLTNAERQRAWRDRQRAAKGQVPRRKGELAAAIAAHAQCTARTIYRSAHYALAIDTIAAVYPGLAAQIRRRRVRIGSRFIGHRLTIVLAEILRDDPEGFAEQALPLIVDRWTGQPIEAP
jgi:hypothetical protein